MNLIRIETLTSTYVVPSTVKEFAYDGCHKCYIIETEEDKNVMTEIGYDFLPIIDLANTFNDSCPLRFINNASLTKSIVPQCEEYVKFIYDDGTYDEFDVREYEECDDDE